MIPENNIMRIICQFCQSSLRISTKKIPDNGASVICPKCKQRIPIKKADIQSISNNFKVNFPSPMISDNCNESDSEFEYSMVCPKCGREQDAAEECVYCGIIVSKFLNQNKTLSTFMSMQYQNQMQGEDFVYSMVCPKCGRDQDASDECIYCGVIISKFLNRNSIPSTSEEIDRIISEKDTKTKNNLSTEFFNHHDEFEDMNREEKFNLARSCIVRGNPIEVVDQLGNIASFSSKLLLLSSKIDNHAISSDVERRIIEFIMHHELYDIKVRLNQFAPDGEIMRIVSNNKMHSLMRFLFGIIYIPAYLLNPGRLFGGDYYNPASNTVNIFSNHVAIALHELGHALDFRNRKYPGLYQAFRFIPFAALYQEWKASYYAIMFLRGKKYFEDEIEAYKILYPAYSTYVFGAVYELVPSLLGWFFLPFIIIGHVIGRCHASSRKSILSYETDKENNFNLTGKFIKNKTTEINTKFNSKSFVFTIIGFIVGLLIFEDSVWYLQVFGPFLGGVTSYWVYNEYLKNKKLKTETFSGKRINP
jgi:predicted Zn finger-like uncharacterized protein